MKPTLFILALLAGICVNSQAQLSKLQYEDAEAAYSEGRYKEALKLLDEAEKSKKGTNYLILHLRIMCHAELIKKDPFQGYDIIGKSRSDVNYFLKTYENEPRAADKYREVYEISKQLKELPPNKEAYDAMVAEKRKKDEELASRQREEEAIYKKARSFGEALMKEYSYKPNCTISELTAMNSSAAALASKKLRKFKNTYYYSSTKITGNPYPVGASYIEFWDGSTTKVYTYTCNMASGKNHEEVRGKYLEMRKRILANVHSKYITRNEEKNLEFLVPDLNVKIWVYIYGYNDWMATSINFKQTKYE
jgi:hypothetical protein